MFDLQDVSKSFTLHNQGGAVIEVLERQGAAARAEPESAIS